MGLHDNNDMCVTRTEVKEIIEEKISTSEAKTNGHIQVLEGKIDNVNNSIDNMNSTINGKLDIICGNITNVKDKLEITKEEVRDLQEYDRHRLQRCPQSTTIQNLRDNMITSKAAKNAITRIIALSVSIAGLVFTAIAVLLSIF